MSSHLALLDKALRDLRGGDPEFPTSMRLALGVRRAVDDPGLSTVRLVELLESHPLIAARLVRLANCLTFNPSGVWSSSLKDAILRIGMQAVRSVVLVVAMDELRRAQLTSGYADLADASWRHSVQLASLCRLIAGEMHGVSPDEAMLTGLVSDLGVNYLLYRAMSYPEYGNSRELVIDLLNRHAQQIGARVCEALGLPAVLVQALEADDDALAEDGLARVLYVARVIAGEGAAWPFQQISLRDGDDRETLMNAYALDLGSSKAHCQAMENAWLV